MKKKIFLFLVLSIVTVCMTTYQTAFAQSTMEPENSPPQPITPRRSLRIIFEGTFQSKRSQNYNQQGMIPGDYINTPLSGNNSLISTNQFSDYELSPYFNNYGSGSGLKNIIFGFDANFTQSNGRRFVLSSRTRFSSNLDPNFNSKETWLKLHTEGKKQSSLVVDFTIRIIR